MEVFTMMDVRMLEDLIGTVIFSVQGALTAKRNNACPMIVVLCSMFCAYGGGFFLRDLIWLHTTPSLFSAGMQIFAALIPAMYIADPHTFEIVEQCMSTSAMKVITCLLDALGMAAFIMAGIDKGASLNATTGMIILAGISTAVGGGMLSQLLLRHSFRKIIRTSTLYRINSVFLTYLYYSIRGTKYVTLHFSIITVIVCCLTDREVCHIITSFLKKRPVPNIPETLYFLSAKYAPPNNAYHQIVIVESNILHQSVLPFVCGIFAARRRMFHRKLA